MPPPPPFVKDISLGLLIGAFGVLFLYGIIVMQSYQYYNAFPSDRFLVKILVGFITVLETLNVVLSCHHNYYYLIAHYGQPEYILRIVWSVWLSDEIGFVIAWLVNMFFVRRIYILSLRKLWLAVAIGILATVRPAFGFTAASFPLVYPEWATFHQHVQWMFITGLSVGLAVDFLIACTIFYYLIQNRGTHVRSTKNIVNLLLWYTVNTTAILSLFAVVEMIFLLVQPNTLTFLGLFQIQIQLYANCFLATLNARQSLRSQVTDVTPMITLNVPSARSQTPVRHSVVDAIKIDTSTNTHSDSGDLHFSAEKSVAV